MTIQGLSFAAPLAKIRQKEKVMSTAIKPRRAARRVQTLPPLENGDRLDQKTFHARYEAMPENVRAELIGGIVYMASPQKFRHGFHQVSLIHWLAVYEDATPGTATHSNSSQILGPESEPQPDAALFVAPEFGGRVQLDKDDYLIGAPDWLGEISSSTESIELHAKKADYESAGVREYVVVALRRKEVFWFVSHRGKFKKLPLDKDGICRSQVFPGLWLDPAALLRRDHKRLLAVLRDGLATPEHAAFVAKLATKGPGGEN
jgi:Putative restriction endonuclease